MYEKIQRGWTCVKPAVNSYGGRVLTITEALSITSAKFYLLMSNSIPAFGVQWMNPSLIRYSKIMLRSNGLDTISLKWRGQFSFRTRTAPNSMTQQIICHIAYTWGIDLQSITSSCMKVAVNNNTSVWRYIGVKIRYAYIPGARKRDSAFWPPPDAMGKTTSPLRCAAQSAVSYAIYNYRLSYRNELNHTWVDRWHCSFGTTSIPTLK